LDDRAYRQRVEKNLAYTKLGSSNSPGVPEMGMNRRATYNRPPPIAL